MYLKKLRGDCCGTSIRFFRKSHLDEQWEQSVPCFEAGPAKVYEQELLSECIQTALDESAPRERILIQQYLGLGNSNGKGMTFQELAVLLNYNGHSAAEKAYKRAVESLRRALYIGEYGKYVWVKRIVDYCFDINS